MSMPATVHTDGPPRDRTGPVLTAAVTVLCAAGAVAGPMPLAVPGGLLLAFVLPGLALTELIFRYRVLATVERAVLTPALSMATMIVAGLGVYVAGFRLDRLSWALGTAGLTLLTLALGAVPDRVWQGEEEDAEPFRVIRPEQPPGPFAAGPPGSPGSPGSPGERGRPARQVLVLVLAAAVLGGAGFLSYRSSHESYAVTVTTLSAAPPGQPTAAGTRQVEVTAAGLVAADGPYTVAVTGPGGTRTQNLPVPAGTRTFVAALTLPAESRMTVGLYRAGDITPYRSVVVAATE